MHYDSNEVYNCIPKESYILKADNYLSLLLWISFLTCSRGGSVSRRTFTVQGKVSTSERLIQILLENGKKNTHDNRWNDNILPGRCLHVCL